MEQITYMRPSGNPIRVNDTEETRALAKELGWKRLDATQAKKKGPKQ